MVWFGWLVFGGLIAWLVDWFGLAGCLFGWLIGWFLVVWLVDWFGLVLVVWLVDWFDYLVGWLAG